MVLPGPSGKGVLAWYCQPMQRFNSYTTMSPAELRWPPESYGSVKKMSHKEIESWLLLQTLRQYSSLCGCWMVPTVHPGSTSNKRNHQEKPSCHNPNTIWGPSWAVVTYTCIYKINKNVEARHVKHVCYWNIYIQVSILLLLKIANIDLSLINRLFSFGQYTSEKRLLYKVQYMYMYRAKSSNSFWLSWNCMRD